VVYVSALTLLSLLWSLLCTGLNLNLTIFISTVTDDARFIV
jgi:hypothetical protein